MGGLACFGCLIGVVHRGHIRWGDNFLCFFIFISYFIIIICPVEKRELLVQLKIYLQLMGN